MNNTLSKIIEALKLVVIGMILGVANVIPGVSGGTIAVVFDIYNRFIEVITLNLKKILNQWKFILPLGVGIVVGIFLFSNLITFLFNNYPFQTNWFFVGIILGSIPMIFGRFLAASKKSDSNLIDKKILVISILCCFIALGIMCFMTYADVSETGNIIQSELTFGLGVKIFLGLALAAIAMIIPGISGSFLMMVMGVYSTIIAAIADFNIPILIPGVFGAIFGLLFGASLVRFLMEKLPAQTYGVIIGLVVGSILVIFPGFEFSSNMITGILFALLGFFISFFASKDIKSKENLG